MGRQKGDPRLRTAAGATLPTVKAAMQELPEGMNAKYIRFMMDTTPMEPLDRHDVAEMRRRFKNYLEKCAEYDMKVGNLAAYAAIGITKQDAWDWTHGRTGGDVDRTNFIMYVQSICTRYREGLMQDGKVHPAVGIFWQKNFDGLRDQTEVVTTNTNMNTESDMDALKQKYLDNAAIVAEAESNEVTEPAEIAQKSSEKVLEMPQKAPEKVAAEVKQKRKPARPRKAQNEPESK